MISHKNKDNKNEYDGMKQQEIADALGISRIAVQQIEKRAIRKFKKELAKRLLAVQDLLWHRKNNRKKNVNEENVEKKNETISREQVVLWAYEAGFQSSFVRGEVTRFETLVNLVKKYMERDYK